MDIEVVKNLVMNAKRSVQFVTAWANNHSASGGEANKIGARCARCLVEAIEAVEVELREDMLALADKSGYTIFDDEEHALAVINNVASRGGFEDNLIGAFIAADGDNFERLGRAFPAYASAFKKLYRCCDSEVVVVRVK